MKVTRTTLEGVLLLEPRRFSDERGYFFESYSEQRYSEVGVEGPFVQDNLSLSTRGVLRGLHFQTAPHAQGKLVSVLSGRVFDVAVDLRSGSPTFGQWESAELSSGNGLQLWIPEGFAHGFQVLSEEALFCYKCTRYYHPQSERTLAWNDPDVGIDWPVSEPLLSQKDRCAIPLRRLEQRPIQTGARAAP